MRFLSMVGVMGISLAVVWPRLLCAEAAPDSEWQKVRDHQPAALHLKMTLPKKEFYQGEKIDATLDFSNDDAIHPYSVAVGVKVFGVDFHATDEKGGPVIDPLGWYKEWWPEMPGGLVASQALGNYTAVVPVNESVRFDRSGVYRLYATSNVREGTSFEGQHGATLVSDETIITILPLTADQEKADIDDALRKIGSGDPKSKPSFREGINELEYLQTPAARDKIIALLGQPRISGWLRDGLFGAPDPAAEADQILKEVQAGKLVLDEHGVERYADLRLFHLISGSSPLNMTQPEIEKRFNEIYKTQEAARQEVTAAAVAASGTSGAPNVEALWTAFVASAVHGTVGDYSPAGGAARAGVIAHQLELSPEHIKRLFGSWVYWGGADFLPLIRREAARPTNNLEALTALAGLRPDEARPAIIQDLESPKPRLLERGYSSEILCRIQPMPMPQFDALFRAKLAEKRGDAFPIIPVICCFASPALLPDVVKAYQEYGRDVMHGNNSWTQTWGDEINGDVFRYWLRSDSQAGAVALEQEIEARGNRGWGFLRFVFDTSWTDDSLPVIQWALRSPDPTLASAAIYLLEKHGADSSIDSAITALEKFRNSKENVQFSASNAAYLLKSRRWHYTDEQKKRLEALVAAAPPE
jgi:hypothetical protein